MADLYNGTDPVSVGEATKADDYHRVFNNTVSLREGWIALASQAVNDFVYALSTTQFGRLAAAQGRPRYNGSAWQIGDVSTAISIATNVLTVNMNLGEVFEFTLSSNITTMTIQNIPASGKVGYFMLKVKADGTGRTWTWFSSTVHWEFAIVPTVTVTVNKYDFFAFMTLDGGTTWFGFVPGQNFT